MKKLILIGGLILLGVKFNFAFADGISIEELRKKANDGDAGCMSNLGYCYHKGEGVEKSLATAVYWYKKAAENGNAQGQVNLASCYGDGSGIA